MGRFDFVRTRPDFAGTGAHDRGFFRHASHDPVKVVISKSLIVRLEESANRLQLWILGFGRLSTCGGWYRDCGSNTGGPRQNGFSSVHSFVLVGYVAPDQQGYNSIDRLPSDGSQLLEGDYATVFDAERPSINCEKP